MDFAIAYYMPRRSIFQELKRRRVFTATVAYVVVAWLVLQVADVVAPLLALPDWVGKLVLLLLVVGLPVVVVLAWAFDLTPEGFKRDTGPEDGATPTAPLVAAAATPTRAIDGKSVAVLPLTNLSGDEANEPFTTGVHDDLVTEISKIRSIKTISRTSVMRYRHTTSTIPQIALELGVATVLEGGIQKSGDRVRVNVQLIDAKSDHHLWSDSYDRQLSAENIFAIQREIATSVAKALNATLSPEEKNRSATVPTKNMAALEEYFAGLEKVAKRTVLALQNAAEHFEKAIELDPGFALAYVGLADAVCLQHVYGNVTQQDMLAKARPLIDKALALDNSLGEAHTSLGGLLYHNGDYEDAEVAYKRALELNPNHATTYHWYGTLLIDGFDRAMESFAMTVKALELDPMSCTININLGVLHDALGDFDAALRQYHRVAELDPEYAIVYPQIGYIYWEARGDLAAALPWFVKAIDTSPASPNYPAYLGLLYLDLGDVENAEHWIGKALALGPQTYRPNVASALLALFRGETENISGFAAKAMELKPNVWWSWAALAQLRNADLRAGQAEHARQRYETAYPVLACGAETRINRTNFRVAIDYALTLIQCGESERSDQLLDQCMRFIRSIPRLGQEGYWIFDAAIYALRGEVKSSVAAIREAVDLGWRASWWYFLKYDPNFDAVRGDREFQALADELEADMAVQLARLE